MKTFTDLGLDEDSPIVKLVKEFRKCCANNVLVPLPLWSIFDYLQTERVETKLRNSIQSLKKGYKSLLNRPYETIHLEDRFSGIQQATIALTCWDQINEDWRFPTM